MRKRHQKPPGLDMDTVPIKIRGKAFRVEESGNLTPLPSGAAVNNPGLSAGAVKSTSLRPRQPPWTSAGTWLASAWARLRGQRKAKKKEEKEKENKT